MATPVFCCGMECGQVGNVGQHWTNDTGTVSVSTTTVRNGARSLRINLSAVAALENGLTFGTGTTKVWRDVIRFATLPNADTLLSAHFYGGTYAGVGFKVSDSKLYAAVQIAGVITFGGTGVSATTGTWYVCDVKTVGSVVTGTSDVQVNTVACGQATGAFAGANSDGRPYRGSSKSVTADIFFEDYLLSETAGDYPLGDGYVNHFICTADGSHNIAGANDFERGTLGTDITNATTDAYLLIDEVPLDDTTPDTNDFINMIAPPNASDHTRHNFGPAPGISTPTTAPRAVEVIAGIHQAGTGLGNMELELWDANANKESVYAATGVAGTTTLTYKRAHFATFAAGAWVITGTIANFNSMSIVFTSPAAVDANPDQYFDCVMIEAEFSAVPPGTNPVWLRVGGVRGMRAGNQNQNLGRSW